MNTLQKSLPEALAILDPILNDVEIAIFKNKEDIYEIDLNTQMKSSCILKLEPQGIIAYRRYDSSDRVNDLADVIELVEGCNHNNYMSVGWANVLRKYYDNKYGNL